MRLYPLAGQPLGFGYLFASHPPFDEVFVLLCTHISLGCRKIGPHIGEHVVLTVPYQSADGTPGGIEIIRPAKTHINDKGRSNRTPNPQDSACYVESLNLQHENICQGH